MKKIFVEMSGDKVRVYEDRYYEKPLSGWITLDELDEKFPGEPDWNSIEIEDESLK